MRGKIALLSILLLCAHEGTAAKKKKPHWPKPSTRWNFSIDESKTREAFANALSGALSSDELNALLDDPRAALDVTVTGIGITGNYFNYFDSRFGLLTPESLNRGRAYKEAHEPAFACARDTYGVPAEAILGLLRVETSFGRYRGKRPLLTTLWSIYAFAREEKRRAWAVSEARYFLHHILLPGEDVFAFLGSPAAAFGVPQFLPSSYVNFAVTMHPGCRPDLNNDDDAIVSVANYLRLNGWGRSLSAREHAILAYNHSKSYMKAVMAYAKAVKKVL